MFFFILPVQYIYILPVYILYIYPLNTYNLFETVLDYESSCIYKRENTELTLGPQKMIPGGWYDPTLKSEDRETT